MEIEYYGRTEKTNGGYTTIIVKRNRDEGNTITKETQILRTTHQTKTEAENVMKSVLALMQRHKETITELKTEIEKTLDFIAKPHSK
jgi:uncharacterized UPF0160 family protein